MRLSSPATSSGTEGDPGGTGAPQRDPAGPLDRILAAPFVLPLGVVALFLLIWHAAVVWSGSQLFPTPAEAGWGVVELAEKGLLFKYIVASLFRVTWGFSLAALVG